MSGRAQGREVAVVADLMALADRAAQRIEEVALQESPSGRVTISLAGGSTPRAAYQHLAGRCVAWRHLEFFFGDERCVSPDAEGSNYRMAREAMLDRLPLQPSQVHRIEGEAEPHVAAQRAEADLRAALGADPWPVLDLMILGMGPDGHTASLFPGAPELEESRRLMVAVHRPEMPQPWRVSMTLPVLNAATRLLVLVGGREKAPTVARALAGDAAIPAGRLRDADNVTWILTEDAASEL